MTEFDTSGRVECDASFQPLGWAIWSDLSPFTQGYVEALFNTTRDMSWGDERWALGFRHLAPETLARIIADCEAARGDRLCEYGNSQHYGRLFWSERQADQLNGTEPFFPPLTVQLGDDGKVRFACETCGGFGEIGGFVSADSGYQSDPCPECTPASGRLEE